MDMELLLAIKDTIILKMNMAPVEKYLLFLREIIEKFPEYKQKKEPPEEYKEECSQHQQAVKVIFNNFVHDCEKKGVNDDFFHKKRKDLSVINERPIIAKLDAMYCIAKGHTFKYHPFTSQETMHYFMEYQKGLIQELNTFK